MKIETKYIQIIIFGAILFVGCSTQNDAWPNRMYHQLNTKYNGLFYAEQYLEEGIKKIEKLHADDYTKILTINKHGSIKDVQSAQSALDNAIEKSQVAIQQHSMEIKGEEKNKLIDRSYMVIGRAQFYKKDYNQAINTFSFLVRKSLNPMIQSEALLWATKCHQELDNKESVRKNIILLEEDFYLNKKQDAYLDEIQADISIKEKYYAEAIFYLKKALKKTKNKNKEARINYALGQLSLFLSEPKFNEAQRYFEQVIKKNPEYEMVFNAKLMRSKAYDPTLKNGLRSSFEKIKKSLEKMLKDDKNIEYKDQIYFALGNLELKNNDTIASTNYLKMSTTKSTFNNAQKMEAHWALANIFWSQKNYIEAYHQSDSAYQLSDSKTSYFNDIKNMRRSAQKVAVQYNIINQGDSIINLVSLPEQQRNSIIDLYIQELKEKDQADKTLDSQSRSSFNSYEFNRQSQNSMNISSGGGWYFYNPSAISLGYSEFLSRWGNRKLEDNWRRKNQNQITPDLGIDGEEERVGPTEKEKYSRDYYLGQLPLSEEEQLILLSKIETAYYDLGGVFKEDLEDYEQSIVVYNQLIDRFPSTDYKQLIYFDIHNIHKLRNDSISAKSFLNKIKQEYPNSTYLRALEGDTTLDIDRDAETYNMAHSLYVDFSSESCDELQKLLNRNKNNIFIAQMELLNAFCQAKKSDKKTFIENLNEIRQDYPKTDISGRIDTIILILKGELDFNPENIYKNEFNQEHYFLLSIEDISINLPELQLSISKFNQKNYKLDSLETKNLLLNKSTQLLQVNRFKNKEEALAYYSLIQENDQTQKTIMKPEIRLFIISENNYKTLLKDKDINKYWSYFNQIYLLN